MGGLHGFAYKSSSGSLIFICTWAKLVRLKMGKSINYYNQGVAVERRENKIDCDPTWAHKMILVF